MAPSQNLIFIVILGLAVSSSYAEECQLSKDSICECTYENGSGYSLKNLVSQDEKFIEARTDENLTFYYNPCNNQNSTVPSITNATGNCDKGFMLCVYNKQFNNYTLLGSKENAAFMQKDDQMFMSFKKSNDNQLTVLLECTPSAKDTSALYAPKEVTMNEVHLTLYSKLSCIQQIYEVEERGFFSTFFLILFVLLLIYLVLGMLYQYFFVGARGLEMLPNYDFWQKVWISMKLGFIYIKNGCKVIPTDESYDAI